MYLSHTSNVISKCFLSGFAPFFFTCRRNHCQFELYLSSLFDSEIIVTQTEFLFFICFVCSFFDKKNPCQIVVNLFSFFAAGIIVKSYRTFILYWPREIIAKLFRSFLLFCGSQLSRTLAFFIIFCGSLSDRSVPFFYIRSGNHCQNALYFFIFFKLDISERFEQQISNQTVSLRMFCHLISETRRTGIRMQLPAAEGIAPADLTRRVQQLGGFHHFQGIHFLPKKLYRRRQNKMKRTAVSSKFRLFRVKERGEDFGQYSTVRFLFHINVASSVLDPVTFFYGAGPLSNGSGRGSGRPKNTRILQIQMRNQCFTTFQCCLSGSGLIRLSWIWIRIRIWNEDPEPQEHEN